MPSGSSLGQTVVTGAGAISREPCTARSDDPVHSARLPATRHNSAKDRFRAPRRNPFEFHDHPRTRTHHVFRRFAEDERLLWVQSRDLHRGARERAQCAASGHLRDLDRTGRSTPCGHSHRSCAPANPLDLEPEWPISNELQKPADGKDCFCPARVGLFRHFSFTPPPGCAATLRRFPRVGVGWVGGGVRGTWYPVRAPWARRRIAP